MMAATETCVTPTDLAAFLEGSVMGEERDQMVRHLNHCPDCFERYIGAARLLDSIEGEEASALSAADGNRAVDPSLPPGLENLRQRCRKLLLMPISLPWRSRRYAWPLPLAAVILAYLGVVAYRSIVYWDDLGGPTAFESAAPRRTEDRSLAPDLFLLKGAEFEGAGDPLEAFYDLPKARREAFDEEIPHIVPGHQGNGPEGMTLRKLAFQLGARWIDLHPVLRSQSTTLTERALRNLREILPARFLRRHPPCSRLLFPQATEPEKIDVCLDVIERVFHHRPEFALGCWTEATRLAIAAGTDRYFTYTIIRRFPERFLTEEYPPWDDGVRAELERPGRRVLPERHLKEKYPLLNDGVRAELERAGKILEGGLSPGEGKALEAVLQDLARFYEVNRQS